MVSDDIQNLFIEEAKSFFNKHNLEFGFRDNINGVCKFISPETKTILLYFIELDLSINLHFEKAIDFRIEHYNSFTCYMDYEMNIYRCKLSMVLEYIETHRKLHKLKKELKSPKLETKWKTKILLEKLGN